MKNFSCERYRCKSRLNSMVWEDHWRPKVFGQPASIMVDAFQKKAVQKAFDERESKLRVILGNAQATIDRADALLGSLQQTMTCAEKIMDKTEFTGGVFNELVGSVDRLAA